VPDAPKRDPQIRPARFTAQEAGKNGATVPDSKVSGYGFQAGEREEREAIRSVEGQGDVEGAGSEDRQLAGRVAQRRKTLTLRVKPQRSPSGRNDSAEESRRPQRRQSDRS